MFNILGLAGYSGSGKTTLLEKIIPLLVARGLRVAVIKHAHHEFDIDQPGKDSYRQRKAGASEVLITSAQRWALMHELQNETEPTLEECCARLSPCDLVLVEGSSAPRFPSWKCTVMQRGSRICSHMTHIFSPWPPMRRSRRPLCWILMRLCWILIPQRR